MVFYFFSAFGLDLRLVCYEPSPHQIGFIFLDRERRMRPVLGSLGW